MDGIAELSKSLQQMDIDASAYACLSALTLVSGKHRKLSTPPPAVVLYVLFFILMDLNPLKYVLPLSLLREESLSTYPGSSSPES